MDFLLEDDPLKFYNSMLRDVERARQYIYIETYKFGNDAIGNRFRDALTKKSRQGVIIKLLIDSWGTYVSETFFAEMIKKGGEVRFFSKIRFNSDIFTRGHRRDHRKIIIIDDHIAYINSSNFTEYNINWRELSLRVEGELAKAFKTAFLENYDLYNKYILNKPRYAKSIRFGDFEIVRDVPGIQVQRIKKRYEQLIKSARKSIVIETPYFLPGYLLRKALIDAGRHGVDVKIIMPKNSDVRLVDILRNKYLGMFYKNNNKLLFYKPSNLHAKLLLIDNKIFALGSPNFDYRSFRYMFEIILVGREQSVIRQIQDHINETLAESEPFDYQKYLKRPTIEKIIEWFLVPFRHLL
ncbi:MAG: phosphatidylserine/phosphatidylglycerophosphate/cardiolipin synthase family protein [Bacteroidetes bacterium]|nr:phosphatidylserine/phosphatidylglycerophosphate/cardiolipin synthase family protein [Bacteroidota bacterium]